MSDPKAAISWTFQVKSEPGTGVMETAVWGSTFEFLPEGKLSEDQILNLARVVGKQFSQTLARELGASPETMGKLTLT